MPGEHAEGLTIVLLKKRYMFQALDRFKLEGVTKFIRVGHHWNMFGFLNLHAQLQSDAKVIKFPQRRSHKYL